MARADGATNFFGNKKITSIFCCCCVTLSGNIEGPVFLCVIYNKWGWNDSLLLCMSKLSRFEIGKKGTDDWQITQSKASFLLCFFFFWCCCCCYSLRKKKETGEILDKRSETWWWPVMNIVLRLVIPIFSNPFHL